MLKRIFIALVFVTAGSPALHAQSFSCDSSTNVAAGLKKYIVLLVTAQPGDSLLNVNRVSHHLPWGSADIVQFESDPAIGTAAGMAFYAVLSPGNPPAQRDHLVVIRVGTDRLIVYDPDQELPESEFELHVIFDSEWNVLASFAA